jgi:hypothetical protein
VALLVGRSVGPLLALSFARSSVLSVGGSAGLSFVRSLFRLVGRAVVCAFFCSFAVAVYIFLGTPTHSLALHTLV